MLLMENGLLFLLFENEINFAKLLRTKYDVLYDIFKKNLRELGHNQLVRMASWSRGV